MTEFPRKRRIIFGLLLFILTLIPVSSLSQWYQEVLAGQGREITGAVTHSLGEVSVFFLGQLGPFLNFAAKPFILFLLKWSIVGLFFWWCGTRLKIPDKLSKFINTLERIIFQSHPKRFQIALVVTSLSLTCLLAYAAGDLQPDNPDSAAQLFQAKIFSEGRLYLPMPKDAEFFHFPYLFPQGDKWFSLYNPGHPFLLMLGLMAGIPWLVNSLTGAGSLLLLYKIARAIYEEKTARLGTLMFLLSPMYLFISSGYMNNASSLLFTLLFIYFYIHTLRSDKLSYPFGGGFFLGAIATVRPLTAMIFGLSFGLYTLIKRKHITSISGKFITFTAGCTITLGGLFLYNYLTNGHLFMFNYSVYHHQLNPLVKTMGFGPAPWGVTHTPFRGLVHIWNSLQQLNQQMFSWPIASLALIFLFFVFSPKITAWDRLFLFTAIGLIGIHFFFFVIRVRYFYSVIPLLAILCARGARLLPRIVHSPSWNRKGTAVFITLFLILGFSFAHIQEVLPALVLHQGMEKNRLPRLAAKKDIHNAIIFTKGGYGGWGIYIYGFNHMQPVLEENDIIYALDLKTHNHTLAQRYPHRKTYRYIPEQNEIIPYHE